MKQRPPVSGEVATPGEALRGPAGDVCGRDRRRGCSGRVFANVRGRGPLEVGPDGATAQQYADQECGEQ